MNEQERQMKAEAWQECVDWFALRGPLNGSERVKSYVLEEAEQANPYEEWP